MTMKNILVTGVSKGLGLNITKQLLEKECNVYGIYRTMTPELSDLQMSYSGNLHLYKFDLENTHNIKVDIFKTWLNDVVIDGYVNNAAYAYDTLITNIDLEELIKMTNINQLSPMLMTKYVIRNMILNNVAGSIIHISSISVHTGYKGLAMYAATKGALEAFSKNTAREWGTKGIRSNCIVAGFMETDMTKVMDDATKEKIYKRTSLKKPINVDDVASTTFFLLSSGSSSITGQNIFVDNGTI